MAPWEIKAENFLYKQLILRVQKIYVTLQNTSGKKPCSAFPLHVCSWPKHGEACAAACQVRRPFTYTADVPATIFPLPILEL